MTNHLENSHDHWQRNCHHFQNNLSPSTNSIRHNETSENSHCSTTLSATSFSENCWSLKLPILWESVDERGAILMFLLCCYLSTILIWPTWKIGGWSVRDFALFLRYLIFVFRVPMLWLFVLCFFLFKFVRQIPFSKIMCTSVSFLAARQKNEFYVVPRWVRKFYLQQANVHE